MNTRTKAEDRDAHTGAEVRKLIAIGASAGGLKPLLTLLSSLPAAMPCAILIATHLGESHQTHMADLLGRRSKMPVVTAADGDLLSSMVYVVPPGTHLMIEGRRMRLLHTAPIRFLRPNLDLLFQSVAESFGSHAVGVVLSGMGKDGAEGLRAIKLAGGTTLAEDPRTAEFPEMPKAAVKTGLVDWVLGSDTIGKKLIELCMETGSTAEWQTNSR